MDSSSVAPPKDESDKFTIDNGTLLRTFVGAPNRRRRSCWDTCHPLMRFSTMAFAPPEQPKRQLSRQIFIIDDVDEDDLSVEGNREEKFLAFATKGCAYERNELHNQEHTRQSEKPERHRSIVSSSNVLHWCEKSIMDPNAMQTMNNVHEDQSKRRTSLWRIKRKNMIVNKVP